ncbi:MAG: hypothetical protein J6X18_02545 [Bacteroidales bacterium]|nr:hypothetical protein [Bacteroidales bacterium]
MKKFFTLVSVLCACVASAFAQAPQLSIEGESWDTMYVTIPYEKTELDRNNDGIADEWLAGSREYFEDNVWNELEKEGVFTFYLKGTSPFTGRLMIAIADDREDANNWAALTDPIYIEVKKDKEFTYTGYTKINNLELQTTDGANGKIGDEVKGGLTTPKYFMAAFPEEGVESGANIELVLPHFEFRYTQPNEIIAIPIPDVKANFGDMVEPIKLTDYFINPYNTKMSFEIERHDQEEEEYPSLFQAKIDGDYLRISALDDGSIYVMIFAYAIDPNAEEGSDWPYISQNNSVSVTISPRKQPDGSDCDLKVSIDVTNASCVGTRDGSALAIVTGGVEPYSYRWNTGRTSAGIYNVGAGYYYVNVVDSAGCSAYASETITEPYVYATYSVVQKPTCGNEDGIVTFDEDSYTYTWSNGATGQTVENIKAGTYTVTIADETGCSIEESVEVMNGDIPSFSTYSYWASSCTIQDGFIGTSLQPEEGITIYLDGEKLEEVETNYYGIGISNVAAGTHTIAVENEAGCRNESVVEVPAYTPQPEIYAVTYSEDSKSVIVMWEYDYIFYDDGGETRNSIEGINYFTIYRETSEGKGEYDSIGYAKPEFPLYQDEDISEPNGSYRYKISATDLCGKTSPMGIYENKTIGLTMDTTVVVSEDGSESKTTVDLSWTPYEGKFLEAYLVYRITKSGNLEVAKVGPFTTHYTEELPAGTKGYFVAVKFCDTLYLNENNIPGLKAESGPFSLALSNVAELENADAVASIDKELALVYTANKSIVVNGAQSSVAVFDLQGRPVTKQTANGTVTIPIAKMGIYIVLVDGKQVFEVIVK